MKKLRALTLIIIITNLFLTKSVYAQENRTGIHLFWRYGCPHCEKEKEFLREYKEENPQVEIYFYEVGDNRDNALLFTEVGETLNASVSSIPFTVIGDKYIIGFRDAKTTGQTIKEAVTAAELQNWPDIVANLKEGLNVEEEKVLAQGTTQSDSQNDTQNTNQLTDDSETVDILFWKNIEIKSLSLPAVTFVIALADGFNPCAMWVMLFLISLLLGMKDRRRMWLIGGTFIAVSGLVYFLFLTAWLNLFLFIGYLTWVRVAIGLVALYAGYSYIKSFIQNKDGTCKVVEGHSNRKMIFEKLKGYVNEKNLAVSLVGIAALAVSVNLVEFLCSAGLPAVYTQTLSMANLPTYQYYLYILFYVLIFMLDDFVVFILAMKTLKSIGLNSKYARYTHLVGGVLMAAIGILIIFKPELLTLG